MSCGIRLSIVLADCGTTVIVIGIARAATKAEQEQLLLNLERATAKLSTKNISAEGEGHGGNEAEDVM